MMDIDKADHFFLDRICGLIGFLGMVLIVNFDRLPIYFLYKYFSIKVHGDLVKNILSGFALFLGISIFCAAFYRTIIERSVLFNSIGMTIMLLGLIFMRLVTLRAQDYYFPLDDNFYLDKNGHDIREKK